MEADLNGAAEIFLLIDASRNLPVFCTFASPETGGSCAATTGTGAVPCSGTSGACDDADLSRPREIDLLPRLKGVTHGEACEHWVTGEH